MGTLFVIGRTRFTIPPRAEERAFRAIVEANAAAEFHADLRDVSSFEDAMIRLGWRLRRSAAGHVRGLVRALDKAIGDERATFEAIAPFVDAGSFIEYLFEDENQPTRVEFTGHGCRFVRFGELPPEEDVLEEADRAAALVPPTWADLSPPQEPDLQPFKATMTFIAGTWLSHVKFGPGYVFSAAPDKITVVFEDGVRTLVHAR